MEHASAEAGTVLLEVTRPATVGDPETESRAVLHASSGAVRSFDLQGEWSQAEAGARFLAWSDTGHIWILPDGAVEPVEVASDPDGLWMAAAGPYLYWRFGSPADQRLATLDCSDRAHRDRRGLRRSRRGW